VEDHQAGPGERGVARDSSGRFGVPCRWPVRCVRRHRPGPPDGL